MLVSIVMSMEEGYNPVPLLWYGMKSSFIDS